MRSQIVWKVWRLVNAIIIAIGLMMDWTIWTWRYTEPSVPISGWAYLKWEFLSIFTRSYDGYLYSSIVWSKIYDFVFVIFLALLAYYLIFNLASIVSDKFKIGLWGASLFLGGMVALFPYVVNIHDYFYEEPYYGFRVFAFGLILAFLLEWSFPFVVEINRETNLFRITHKAWRLINTVVICAGLIMTWEGFYGMDSETESLIAGWQYLGMDYWIPVYWFGDFDIIFLIERFFLFWLFDIALIYYLILNLKSINNDVVENLEKISVALCWGLFLPFLSLFVFPDIFSRIHPFGFLIFAMGVGSSALLERSSNLKPIFNFEIQHESRDRLWRIFNVFMVVKGLFLDWGRNIHTMWPIVWGGLVEGLLRPWLMYEMATKYINHGYLTLLPLLILVCLLIMDILLIYYLVCNGISLIEMKSTGRLEIVSVTLFCVSLIPSVMLIWYFPGMDYSGVWLFMIGLCSSIALEWLPKFFANKEIHPS